MPKVSLEVCMSSEGVGSVAAWGADFRYYFRLSCGSCGEAWAEWQYLTEAELLDLPGGRGQANFVSKCKFCQRQGSLHVLPASAKPFDPAKGEVFQSILKLDCRGVEPTEFQARLGWRVTAADSPTVFEDVDLTEGEWAEYDERADQALQILDFKSRFVPTK